MLKILFVKLTYKEFNHVYALYLETKTARRTGDKAHLYRDPQNSIHRLQEAEFTRKGILYNGVVYACKDLIKVDPYRFDGSRGKGWDRMLKRL